MQSHLGTLHMVQPRVGKHQSSVPIWKRSLHAGPAAALAVQPLNHIVGADACPVFAGKVAVGRCLFNAVLDLLGLSSVSSLTVRQQNSFRLLAGGLLAPLHCPKPVP